MFSVCWIKFSIIVMVCSAMQQHFHAPTVGDYHHQTCVFLDYALGIVMVWKMPFVYCDGVLGDDWIMHVASLGEM